MTVQKYKATEQSQSLIRMLADNFDFLFPFSPLITEKHKLQISFIIFFIEN